MAEKLSSVTPEQISQLKRRFSGNPDAINQVEIVLKYKDKFGVKSIIAWDYARYISLCGVVRSQHVGWNRRELGEKIN